MKLESASLLTPLPAGSATAPAAHFGVRATHHSVSAPATPAARPAAARPSCRGEVESPAEAGAGRTSRASAYGWRAMAWLVAATALTAVGGLAWLPMPFPQVILAVTTAALVLCFGRGRSFRAWILGLDLRMLLLPHLTRFVGGWFIVLHFRSELPYAFAVPGGIGDLAAAVTAIAIACVPARRPAGRWAWMAWNTFGLADILFVVATAARLGLADPASMAALTRFPLGLLPTFIVPLILFSHVAIYVRLFAPRTTEAQVR